MHLGQVCNFTVGLTSKGESDDHRVVVGSAVGSRELGVDVHRFDLGAVRQWLIDQHMVEDLRITEIDVAVPAIQRQPFDQVFEPRFLKDSLRVLSFRNR